MKTFFKIFLSLFLISNATQLFAQGYEIEVTINALADAEIYLGYYYGDKTYVKDTVRLDNKGKGEFKADTLLPQGVYIVGLPSKNYFDLLIGDDQQFAIETTSDDLVKNMKFTGSKENQAFKEYQELMMRSEER